MTAAEADRGLIAAIYDAALDAGRWPAVLQRLAQEFNDASVRLSFDQLSTRGCSACENSLVEEGRRRGLPAPLTQEQSMRLSALTPHLRRAMQLNRSLGELRLACDLACEALHQFRNGILVVEADARILLANRAAEALLADPDGVLRMERQHLAARRRADCAALLHLIGMAVDNGTRGSFVISRERHPAVVVLVMAAGVVPGAIVRAPLHAIVMVKDLAGAARRASDAFGRYFALTPAQMALANEIARGEGVRAAARRLRISYGTARAHLLQIFQKTGTRRQTELVRLMMVWDDGIGQVGDIARGHAPVPAHE